MKIFKKIFEMIAIIAAIIAVFCFFINPGLKAEITVPFVGTKNLLDGFTGYNILFGTEHTDPSWVGIVGWAALLAGIIVGTVFVLLNKTDYISVCLYLVATVFIFCTGAHVEPDATLGAGLIVPGVFALVAFLTSLIPIMLKVAKK